MRTLLTLVCLLAPVTALAQDGIVVGTPITFSTPATITVWDIKSLLYEPGDNARILVELVGRGRPDVVLTFEYPRDCGSFGSSGNPPVPNPPVCANLDTSSEVNDLITALNTANLGTRSLRRRTLDRLCADFPSRFPGGCTVQ